MLSRAYDEGVLVVLADDFNEYLSGFGLDKPFTRVLETCDVRQHQNNGVNLVSVYWNAGPNKGIDGDEDLLRAFKGKPRRFILLGGNFDIYETTENMSDENMSEAFRMCYKRAYTVRVAGDVTEVGPIGSYVFLKNHNLM